MASIVARLAVPRPAAARMAAVSWAAPRTTPRPFAVPLGVRMLTQDATAPRQVPPVSRAGTSLPAQGAAPSSAPGHAPASASGAFADGLPGKGPVGGVGGNSTTDRSLPGGAPSSAPQATARLPPRPSKHKLLYSEVIPPLLWVLAYSTATYFALALIWNVLKRSEERSSHETELGVLQREIRAATGAKEI